MTIGEGSSARLATTALSPYPPPPNDAAVHKSYPPIDSPVAESRKIVVDPFSIMEGSGSKTRHFDQGRNDAEETVPPPRASPGRLAK
jgi:hypothetical protein